jgi:hypothetical protein
VLDIDTSEWFTDPDASDTLSYTLTNSDSSTRPNWLGYDTTTGILRGFPSSTTSSEFLNLRFTAIDDYDGQ